MNEEYWFMAAATALLLILGLIFGLEWLGRKLTRFLGREKESAFTCLAGDCHNGFGIARFANGNRYEGEYLHGKKSGQGTFLWRDGRKFVGTWRDGRMHGEGVITYPLGGRYEGEFVADRKEGQGIYRWPNGGSYTGKFARNKRNGYGTYVGSDGQVFRGIWQDDRLVQPR